jgi:phenolphthiocerol/phthiocerol/phthiodiolone dimycocerosyl transferase
VHRYLDDIEVLHLNKAPSHVLRYQGDLDVSILARAFEMLGERYPAVRSTARRAGDRYVLAADPLEAPKLRLVDGGEAAVVHEIEKPWSPSTALADLVVAREPSGGVLALRMDHAIGDAGGKLEVLGELLRLYAAMVETGEASTERSTALPASPLSVLRSRSDAHADQAAVPDTTAGATPIDVRPARQRHTSLDERETAGLVAAARAEGVSVHALVCGHILLGQYLLSGSAEPMVMACSSAVDLRNRVSPPVGRTETTNFFGVHTAHVEVSATSRPADIGREVVRQLHEAVAAGQVSIDLRTSESVTPAASMRESLRSAAVSNLGVLPPFPQPEGMVITDFEAFADLTPALISATAVYTYGGRLRMRFVYPAELFSSDDVDEIVGRTMELLRNAAADRAGQGAAR